MQIYIAQINYTSEITDVAVFGTLEKAKAYVDKYVADAHAEWEDGFALKMSWVDLEKTSLLRSNYECFAGTHIYKDILR